MYKYLLISYIIPSSIKRNISIGFHKVTCRLYIATAKLQNFRKVSLKLKLFPWHKKRCSIDKNNSGLQRDSIEFRAVHFSLWRRGFPTSPGCRIGFAHLRPFPPHCGMVYCCLLTSHLPTHFCFGEYSCVPQIRRIQ